MAIVGECVPVNLVGRNAPRLYQTLDIFQTSYTSIGYIKISFEPSDREKAILQALQDLTMETENIPQTKLLSFSLDPYNPHPSQATIYYQWEKKQRHDLSSRRT